MTGPRKLGDGEPKHKPLKIDLDDVVGRIAEAYLEDIDGDPVVTIPVYYLTAIELEDDGSVWHRRWSWDEVIAEETQVGHINPMLSSWKIAEELQSIATAAAAEEQHTDSSPG